MPYAEHSPPVTAHIGWAFRRLQIIPPRGGWKCKTSMQTFVEDVYDAAGLSIGIVNAVLLGIDWSST